jgi:hypothetical protein
MTYRFGDRDLEAIFARKQDRPPGGPFEDAWKRTSWAWILSHHNVDLAVIGTAYMAAVILVVAVVLGLKGADLTLTTSLQIIFSTAVFGTVIELLRRTYDTAVRRLATVDLFTSEILSIVRVFAAGNIIGDFVRLYDKVEGGQQSSILPQSSAGQAQATQLGSGFADSARKENYFSIFDKNSSDLGSLDPAVVNDITAFYTFLKAARDATGALQLWKEQYYDATAKKEDVISVVYLCFLMAVHGKLALDRLIASAVNRNIVDDIFAGVQLQCFAFLDHVLSKNDFRRPRIEQRRDNCIMLREKHGYAFGPARANP